MSKIELSLHKNYVPDWSTWEGIREIMQNAMDENDRGNRISVKHSVKKEELVVGNEGSELTIQHLLIGFTTKAGDDKARGEKGEGLDLGLLALVREGFGIEVRTPTETWVPCIEMSDKWGEEVLFINTRKVSQRRDGTYITIKGVTEELWNKLEIRFLDFASYDPEYRISDEYHGDLLLQKRYKGMIFVKGIYVQTDMDMQFGYNLKNVGLDRDRRMVASYDLGRSTSKMLSVAVAKRPEKMTKIVWEMINNEVKDAQGWNQWNTDASIKEAMSKMWKEEHGDDAVPVSNMGESEEMGSFGRRGIVAPKVLRDIVDGEVDSAATVQKKMANATTTVHSWDDLTEAEHGVCAKACKTIDEALRAFRGNHALCMKLDCISLYAVEDERTMNMIKIVDFRNDAIRGMCETQSGEIQISRRVLDNYFLTLGVMIHEMAHRISRTGDTKIDHSRAIESLWLAVYFASAGE